MIIVTGASKGLGKAICERLVKNGVSVLALARDVEGLSFHAMNCDVSSYESVKTIAQYIKKEKLEITGLVNAAGVASMNLAITTPPSVVQRIISTNLMGTIYCCQLFSPFMIRKRHGSIINFSTIAVPLGLKGESVYVASKAGVEAFTRTFAREMADFNIGVNCIAPGPIATDLLNGVSASQIEKIISQQIIKRQFVPNSIADLVDLLLDPRSESLTGHVLNVGGV